MIKIEKDKLIIEIETTDPEEYYAILLRDIIMCVQSALADKDNDKLHDSLHFLLELYRAMLPTERQIESMFAKKQEIISAP